MYVLKDSKLNADFVSNLYYEYIKDNFTRSIINFFRLRHVIL